MAKLPKPRPHKPNKTRSGKLRAKSEILDALDGMPFDGAHLVSTAGLLAETLQGSGKATLRRVRVPKLNPLAPAQIAGLRERLNLSQAVFAAFLLGVRPASVMSWEYGCRTPSGPFRRLLEIATRHPEVLVEMA
jgi:putative transcriptional regulator